MTEKSTADELLEKGYDFYISTEWDRAFECWEKAKEIYEELRDKQGISNALINLGIVHQNKGEWERALEYYKKSLKISEEFGNQQGISNVFNNLGVVYQNKGEWERAHEYFEKSLKISEELGNQQGISYALGNLGIVYKDKGEWERALEYYEKSLKISEKIDDKQGISNALGNMGEVQTKNGNWDEAKKNLNGALEISEKFVPISSVDDIANLGELYRLEEQYNDCFAYFDKALSIAVQVGLKPKEIDIHEKLGDTHLDIYIANKKEESLSSAEKFYDLARKTARSLNMPLQEATAIRGIGVVQAKKRDLVASKKSFMRSIEILRRLGASYELQKTLLEYAKVLYETNVLIEAEMVAKTSAFDSLRHDYRELLVKLYLLLGDIEMRKEEQYEYYLDALKVSEFNPKIYVRTCFILIYRMKTMEKQTLLRFIEPLKEVNMNRDKYFNQFLEALNAKINGKKYDISGLPNSLEKELESF